MLNQLRGQDFAPKSMYHLYNNYFFDFKNDFTDVKLEEFSVQFTVGGFDCSIRKFLQ